jgi:predicted nucleic acid-binding protein
MHCPKILFFYERLLQWFDKNIIPVDLDIMTQWGTLAGRHTRTLPVLDSLLAATCLNRRMTLLTRNLKDFADIDGLSVINPWDTPPG